MPTEETTQNSQNKKPVQLRARAGLLALAGMFNVPRKLNQIGTGCSFRVLNTAVNRANFCEEEKQAQKKILYSVGCYC
jgi:hypothetical protein